MCEDTKKIGDLYLKGSSLPGKGKTQIGHCIKSQSVWMVMKLAKLENKFEIHFIDEKTKQTDRDFKKIGATMTPVLAHGESEIQDVKEVAKYLEEHFSGAENPSETPDAEANAPLITSDIEANALVSTATPMSHLVGWIKNTDPTKEDHWKKKFCTSLGDINHTLGRIKEKDVGPFLCGSKLKFPDCVLLPKLYHVRVAALYTKNYQFSDPRDPENGFRNIVNYLKAAQDIPAFRETCPSEKEIQEKWKDYKIAGKKTKQKR